MTRDQLIRKLRKLARQTGIAFRIDKKRGKGSHWTLHYGRLKSTCPAGELMKGTFEQILANLGVDEEDLP